MCTIFLSLPFTDKLVLADTADSVASGTPYQLVNGEQKYDVTVNHVIINQVGGANATSPATNGFVELYNPTDADVDLSSWSIQYKSSAAGLNADAWVKLNLTGTIGAHGSYLIRSKEMNPNGTFQVPEGDQEWTDVAIYEKGFSVVLLDNQTLLAADTQPFNNTTKAPAVTGYVDMVAANGNDSLSTQKCPAYEKEASDIQSSKKAVRRVYFQDTDDNSESGDLEIVDYYTKDTNFITWATPRNSKDGAWEASDRPVPTQTTTLSETEPNALTNTIGKDFTEFIK